MRCGWSDANVASETMQWPCAHCICVVGELSSRWSDRLGGMDITMEWREGRGMVTVLLGLLEDQAALYAVLDTLFELRLPLVSVEAIEMSDASGRGLFIS